LKINFIRPAAVIEAPQKNSAVSNNPEKTHYR